jgi:hypothetical protein
MRKDVWEVRVAAQRSALFHHPNLSTIGHREVAGIWIQYGGFENEPGMRPIPPGP